MKRDGNQAACRALPPPPFGGPPPSEREAVESVCLRGQNPKSHLPEKSKSITFLFLGGEGCAQPTRQNPKSHLHEDSESITDLAKPMSSSLREPTRSPRLPKRRLTQTKLPHPNTVSPTHRKVRSAIPTRFILRLPSSCSRAISGVKRMRNEALRRGDHLKTSLFAEAFSPRREKAGYRVRTRKA